MPADRLTPQQLELLHQILRHPLGIQRNDLDGRTVRALEARELVEHVDGTVRATGRARSEYSLVADRDPGETSKKLRQAQYEMLEQLIRRGPIPDHELDGRTAKSLLGRDLVKFSGGALVVTELGKEMHSNHAPSTNADPRKKHRRGTDPRAQVILKAVGDLRRAIPPDSELAVGPMFCHVDDLLAGFQRLATRRQARRQ